MVNYTIQEIRKQLTNKFFFKPLNSLFSDILTMPNDKGKFIVIDGIDGCGKSTQVNAIAHYLKEKNIPYYTTAEPSIGKYGLLFRENLKNKNVNAIEDALIIALDRYKHCMNEIIPKINQGITVICDRYIDSSIAYQTVQGKEEGISEGWVKTLNRYIIKPDLVIILDVPIEIALKRIEGRNGIKEKFEKKEMLIEIRKKFLEICSIQRKKENNYCLVNCSDNIEKCTQNLIPIIEELFKEV